MTTLRVRFSLPALLLLAAAAPDAYATTIVALASRRSIYVAADGLATSGANFRNRSEVCKMEVVDDTVVASSGVSELLGNFPVRFSIPEARQQAKESWSGKTLQEKAVTFATLAANQLLPFAKLARQQNSDAFDKRFSRRPVVQILLAGGDGFGLPVRIWNLVVDTRNDEVTVDMVEAQWRGLYLMAQTTAFRQMSRESLQFLRALPGDVAARQLVLAEMRANPLVVGPPMSIVELGPGGIKWIEQSTKCKDAHETGRPK